MPKYENSLNPARYHDETVEDYRERRKLLSKMSDKAGKWGRIIYDPGSHLDRQGKPRPVQKEKA